MQVTVASENTEVVTKYLLIEWLNGSQPELSHFLADS